ncbi:MAG: hypothetical protein ABGZ17_04770, partial [Planctomycetaceae bacterium]
AGRKSVETAPVSGTILMDGKPLGGAEVNFMTDDFASLGRTDAQGKYELPAGAAIGENKVFISKWKGGRKPQPAGDDFEDNPEILDDGQLEAVSDGTSGTQEAEQLIPEDFSNPETTTLKFQVGSDGTDKADFRIKSS